MNTTTFVEIGTKIVVMAHLQDVIQALGAVVANNNLELSQHRESVVTNIYKAKYQITVLNGFPEYRDLIDKFELDKVFSDQNTTQLITILQINANTQNIHRDASLYNVFINAYTRLKAFTNAVFALQS